MGPVSCVYVNRFQTTLKFYRRVRVLIHTVILLIVIGELIYMYKCTLIKYFKMHCFGVHVRLKISVVSPVAHHTTHLSINLLVCNADYVALLHSYVALFHNWSWISSRIKSTRLHGLHRDARITLAECCIINCDVITRAEQAIVRSSTTPHNWLCCHQQNVNTPH